MSNLELPILYGLTSTDKVKQWKIEVLKSDEGYGIMRVSHGQMGGKIQVNDKVIKKGKNIGKSNETTPVEQACKEAQSKWTKQTEKNYQEEIPKPGDKPKILLPTHGLDFKHRSKDIKFPCYAQPKLNGVRCLNMREESNINFVSNGGKSYNHSLIHFVEPLNEIMIVNEKIDGEVYYHGWSLQRISSGVKKFNNDTPSLQLWIFDIADDTLLYYDRLIDMNKLSEMSDNIIGIEIGDLVSVENNSLRIVKIEDLNSETCAPIIITPTYLIKSREEMIQYRNIFVSYGFEGIMVKNINGKYIFSKDNKDIQKEKDFEDKEFPIIGGEEGEGLEEGCVIFICEQEDGKPFKARPKGDRETRRIWFQNINDIIGKPLTVRFKDRSDDNIPLTPVGIAIRDYE